MTSSRDTTPGYGDARIAIRGGTALLLLQALTRVTGIAFLLVAGNRLEAADFGRYSTAAALVLISITIADFGMGTSLARLVSRNQTRIPDLLGAAAIAGLGIGTVAAICLAIFAAFAYGTELRTDVWIACAAVPAGTLLNSILGTFDGSGLVARRAFVQFIQSTTVALGGAAVLLGGGSVRLALAMIPIAAWAATLLGTAFARTAGIWVGGASFDRDSFVLLWRTAAPMAAHIGLYALMLRFDVILLSLTHGPAETARYDVTQRAVEACAFIGTAVTGPMIFVLNKRVSTRDVDGLRRAHAKAAAVLYLVGLPLSIAIAALADDMVSVALGPTFADSTTLLILVGGGLWLSFIVFLQSALTNASEDLVAALRPVALIAAGSLVLDAALIVAFGATGAALALLATWALSFAVYGAYHRRVNEVAPPVPRRSVVVGAASMAALSFLLPLPRPLSTSIGVVVYCAICFASGAIGVDQIRAVVGALRR